MYLKEKLAIQDPEYLAVQLVDFIRDAAGKNGKNGCILGNSGGVDSALAAALAARALGREGVKLLFLPERDSHHQSHTDARLVADWLGLPMQTINIAPYLRKMGVYRLEPPASLVPRSIQEKYVEQKNEMYADTDATVFLKMLMGGAGNAELQKHNAYYSIKHRIRMALLYHHAELENLLVLGTTNQSEKMTGLFIKYGDGACDAAPLAHLYKTQVYALSRHLGVPQAIIEKPPTGDLAPGLTDESTLKMDYAHLDPILLGIKMGLNDNETAHAAGVKLSDIAYVRRLIAASEHLRRPPLEPDIP